MGSPPIATARLASSRLLAGARLVALIGWFALCIVPHLLTRPWGRSRWPRRFLGGVARIVGADVSIEGRPAGRGELLVANHVSWLDIPVLAGATGCAFVSKAEMRDHPFLRFIADQNATLYVDRRDRGAIHDQARMLQHGLTREAPLAVFPEGTVGDGGRLLPFKPSLLSAVAPPPPGISVRPVAIDYRGAADALAWAPGEHGLGNFLRVLGRRGRMRVTVRLLGALPPSTDRKALARAAHDAIAAALAPSGIAPAAL